MLVIACVAILGGCGGGHHQYASDGTNRVYRVEGDGTKTLIYEIDADGNATLPVETDPMAQQAIEALEREAWFERVEAQRIEQIQNATKRRPGDRIYVELTDIESRDQLELASLEAMGTRFRSQIEEDDAITLVRDDDLMKRDRLRMANAMAGLSPNRAPVADVTITPRAYVEERVGMDERTGEARAFDIVVIEATITSNFLPAEYTVREQGTVFADTELSRRLAARVIEVIHQSIGPTLPTDRNL